MYTILLMRFVSRSRTLFGRSSGLIRLLPRNTLPSRVTAIRIASLLSASCMAIGFLVFTMSTCTPCCNMGVMTMKMISSTSITSTMGVTLMSDTGCSSRAFLNSTFIVILLELGRQNLGRPAPPPYQLAGFPWKGLLARAGAALGPLQEVVDQLGARVAHLHVKGLNLVGEIVEGPDGGESNEQTDSGGDQRFGNTSGHRA